MASTTQAASEAAGNAAGAAGHAAEKVGMPQLDFATYPNQIFWLVVALIAIYLILSRVALPRIGGILEVRRDRIAQDLDQAAIMKEEADAAIAAYEQELADAKAKANVIGQEARDAAKAEAEAERRKVEAELDEKLSGAEERIAGIKASALKDVGVIAEDTATAIMQQRVGRADKTAIAAAVKAERG